MSATNRLARSLLDTESVTNVRELANHEPSWWLHARLMQIDRAAINDQLGTCAHFRRGVAGIVALWDDQNVWCLRCSASALHLEGAENYRCDRCGDHADPIQVCTIAGRHAVVVFGLCSPCSQREVGR